MYVEHCIAMSKPYTEHKPILRRIFAEQTLKRASDTLTRPSHELPLTHSLTHSLSASLGIG